MKTMRVFAVALVCWLASGCRPTASDQSPEAAAPTGNATEFRAGDDLTFRLADEAGHHMQLALRSFKDKATEEAATHIGKAAAHLQLRSVRARGEMKRVLDESRSSLDELAAKVRDGKTTDVGDLKTTFAAACLAVAQYDYQQADEVWKSIHDYRNVDTGARAVGGMVGHRLRAAAQHLQFHESWSGKSLSQDARAHVDYAFTVGGLLMQGSGYDVKDVTAMMEQFGAVLTSIVQSDPGS